MIRPIFTLFALFVFFITNLSGQNIIKVGSPYIQQYTKNQYRAGNQNWSITTANNGIIYAGNTEGLLSFDGNYWNLHKLPNESTVRSVKVSDDGKIYTGGQGEFGYWQRLPQGRLIYTSLVHLVKDKELLKNDEIWKIILTKTSVIFHAFSKAYIYEKNTIKTITAPGEPFLFSHQVNDRLFFEQIPSGLHELVNNKLMLIDKEKVLQNKNILSILPLTDNSYLIGTAHNGLYILDQNNTIRYWDTPASRLLATYQINNGVKLNEDHYAYGTIKNGVQIINRAGNIIQSINKNTGLQNNTILSMEKDHQNNLWVGLDNGIDHIDINSNLYYYSDFKGEVGTVYSSAIFNKQIYLGTNQGLFVSPWNGVNAHYSFNFRLLPNTSGQVWKLAVINDQLLIGHNDGTFAIDKQNQFKKISTITGGYAFLPINQQYTLQGNYTGISLFKNDNGNFQWIKQFPAIKEPIKFLAQHSANTFWAGNNKEIKLIQFDPLFKNLKILIHSNQDSSLNNLSFQGIYNLQNSLVFSTNKGFYHFDEVIKKFKPYQELNAQINGFKYANKVIKVDQSAYWFIRNTQIAKIDFSNAGKIAIDSNSFLSLSNKMMKGYENIINIHPNYFIIGMDNGFAIYNNQNKTPSNKTLAPVISRIWVLNNGINQVDSLDINLSYDNNSIRIGYSSPQLPNDATKYQYKLENYSSNWSNWTHETFKDYTNLSHGTYTFMVKSVDQSGNESAVTSISFTIEAPWYFSWWAYLIYIILLGIIIYIAIETSRNRIKRNQFQLNKRLLEQQKAAIERETEMNNQKLILLKNQQLEKELEIKNRELSNAATNIMYKNEMLNNLHDQLKNLRDEDGNKLSSDELKKINKLIEEAHNDDRDWDIFEQSFNDAHENFFKKLRIEYPDLVPNDLKLCAYLRLNMSSKEIANLLNITTRGVEIRRYRLRKKLGIPTEKNLTEFLLER